MGSVVLALAAASAQAQSATAQQLYDDGDRWMVVGRLAEACDAFDRSNQIDARAGTLIRLGECREQNHQLASAAVAYRDALTRVKDPLKRAYAQRQLTALEARLSQLTVVVPDDSRLDGLAITCDGAPLDSALWNQPRPVDGGEHRVVAQAQGHEAWRFTAHVPDEHAQIRVDVPRLLEPQRPEPVPPPAQAPGPLAAPAVLPATTPPASLRDDRAAARPASLFTTRRAIATAVAAAAATAVVLGVVLGVSAKGKQTDALALCPDGPACERADAANALIHTGKRQALEANLAFGAAAAAAIAAGALWFTGAPASEHAAGISLRPELAPGQVALIVAGRL